MSNLRISIIGLWIAACDSSSSQPSPLEPDAVGADAGPGPADGPTAACATSNGACSKQDGLVAHWKLDEASDGSAPVAREDATPCNHDLADPYQVASTTQTKRGAAAALFTYDPTAKHRLEAKDVPSLSVFHDGHSYTIALWFQIAQGAPASGKVIIKGLGPDETGTTDPIREFGFEYQHCPPPNGCANHGVTTNHMHLGVFDSSPGGQASVVDIPTTEFDPEAHLNEWIFATLWHDHAARTVNIQLNNGAVYSKSTAGVTIQDTDVPVLLGGLGTFAGIVDDVLIWNRVLTPAERTSVFGRGLTCGSTD